jgi:hypothetical protein
MVRSGGDVQVQPQLLALLVSSTEQLLILLFPGRTNSILFYITIPAVTPISVPDPYFLFFFYGSGSLDLYPDFTDPDSTHIPGTVN